MNDQIVHLHPLLDCVTAKRYSDTDCIDVKMSVDNDKNHALSNVNTCIALEKIQ